MLHLPLPHNPDLASLWRDPLPKVRLFVFLHLFFYEI